MSEIREAFPSAGSGLAGRPRDPSVDNGRFILITLIVIGHAIEPLFLRLNLPSYRLIYVLIYSFHIPALAFISGMLSHDALTAGSMKRIIQRILFPYLVFQVLYHAFDILYLKRGVGWCNTGLLTIFFTPYWEMWYLLSLFFWRLMLPVFARFRLAWIWAILIGVSVGYCDESAYFLGFSKTLIFFPYFIAGYTFGTRSLAISREWLPRIAGVGALLLLGAGLLYFREYSSTCRFWFLGNGNYARSGLPGLLPAGFRLATYAVSFIMIYGFLCLVPRRLLVITKMGERALQVYLLHGFFIILWTVSKGPLMIDWSTWYAHIGVIGVAIALSFLLASPIVARLTRPFVEPEWRPLFKN